MSATPRAGEACAWPPVEELLLHRGFMLLIDRVRDFAPPRITVEAQVRPDAWYAGRDGTMAAWLGIELMAQAVGAYSGLEARARGEPPRLGYLLGTRSYRCASARFSAGTPLRISASCQFRDDSGLGAFECELSDGERMLASATLKVFEQPAGSVP